MIIVEPNEPGPESRGRMINGQGYRRNTPRPVFDASAGGGSVY